MCLRGSPSLCGLELLPDLRTATRMIRPFLLLAAESGGGGDEDINSILDDPNVGDVGLELGAVGVALREAALDDSLLLILESSSSSLVAFRLFIRPAVSSSPERPIAKILRLAIDLSRPVLIHGAARSGLRV